MTSSPPADAESLSEAASDGRPEFLVRMGLLLPCSVDDVEAAYRDRAKQAHPDAGGSNSAFTQLQADYEAALDYAHYHSSRRGWLAANVERYVAQQELIAQIEQLGGTVETQRPEWIAREIGEDFAHLLDTIVAVRLTGPKIGLEEVRFLAGRREQLAQLHRLDLSDTHVDHRAIQCLVAFATLHELDLSGTFAGNRAAAMLPKLPALRRVKVADTFVNWLARLVLRLRRPGLQIITRRGGTNAESTTKRGYRWLFRGLVAYLIVMLIGTHIPETPDFVKDVNVRGADKLVHFAMYCGLAFLLALVWSFRSAKGKSRFGLSAARFVVIALFVAAFATFDELTQPLTGRDRDLMDWLADLAGMTTGLLLFAVAQLYWWRRRESALEFKL